MSQVGSNLRLSQLHPLEQSQDSEIDTELHLYDGIDKHSLSAPLKNKVVSWNELGHCSKIMLKTFPMSEINE